MKTSHMESISELIDTAKDLSDAFGDIADTVGNTAESVGDTFEAIDDVTDLTNIGLSSALKVFEESKELLERIV